jgi:hypothetical protein
MSKALCRVPPVFVLFDGNSINNYPGNSQTSATAYPAQFLDSVSYKGKNVAVSGSGWASLDAVNNGNGNPPFSRRAAIYGECGQTSVYLMVGGIQDYQFGSTAAQAYDLHVVQAGLARAAGFDIVIDSTCTPASSVVGAIETERVAGNVLILADADTAFDAVVDLDDLLPNPADTTYYSDGLHPTEAGALVIANAMKAALVALL